MKPPVDAPASSARFPVTTTPNRSSATSSFSLPGSRSGGPDRDGGGGRSARPAGRACPQRHRQRGAPGRHQLVGLCRWPRASADQFKVEASPSARRQGRLLGAGALRSGLLRGGLLLRRGLLLGGLGGRRGFGRPGLRSRFRRNGCWPTPPSWRPPFSRHPPSHSPGPRPLGRGGGDPVADEVGALPGLPRNAGVRSASPPSGVRPPCGPALGGARSPCGSVRGVRRPTPGPARAERLVRVDELLHDLLARARVTCPSTPPASKYLRNPSLGGICKGRTHGSSPRRQPRMNRSTTSARGPRRRGRPDPVR